MMLDPPQIHSADRTHVLATWRGHVVALWDGAPQLPAVQRFAELLAKQVDARPGGVVYLAQLPATLALPDSQVREAFAKAGRAVSGRIAGIAVTVEGDGFRAAAVRAMVTGIGMMVGGRLPLRCFRSLAEAAAWGSVRLAASSAPLGSADEVESAFATLRSQLGK
jgi:hypothetical protein